MDLRAEIERLVENACLASTCLFSEHLVDGLSNRPSLGSEHVGGGGLYCGVLTSECTHLITQCPEGEKFKFAKSRSIHVVSIKWFVQCLLAGARQNEDDYTVENDDKSAHTTLLQNYGGCSRLAKQSKHLNRRSALRLVRMAIESMHRRLCLSVHYRLHLYSLGSRRQ
ncbi:hypothetical protein GGI16_008804 [Coemansia sp. S142-1]|nr:hypothetical protein GGI16_008804 [Coemansia sp. S142-1]